MENKIKATVVFEKNYDNFDKYKILVNEGGTGSSKTISICQLWIAILAQTQNKILTIVRSTTPALKKTVMRDFFNCLNQVGMYNENCFDKTNKEYYFHNNLIEFVSMDDPQKKRGAKRDYLWCNEGNELSYEDIFQLLVRTRKKIIFDYNPSDEFHWIYDFIDNRNDCLLIRSSFRDNPFLDSNIVLEIEKLKDQNPNYWKIYGLGERGKSKQKIYEYGFNWFITDEDPVSYDEIIYGLDFGCTNPSALLQLKIKDGAIYEKCLLYETGLTNTQLIKKCKEIIPDIKKSIYADTAEPDRIKEFYNDGFNIHESIKSVSDGIDFVKRYKVYVHKDSAELIKEKKGYSWRVDKNDRIMDGEPVCFNDHLMGAERYAIHTHFGRIESNKGLLDFTANQVNKKESELNEQEKKINYENERIKTIQRRFSAGLGLTEIR